MGEPVKSSDGANGNRHSWRDDALNRLLTILTAFVPIVVISATILRAPPRFGWLTFVLWTAALLVFLLRFLRVLPFRPTAWLSIGAMYVPGLLSISQYGLNAGSFLAAACAIVLAAIYFNRGTALVLLALMLLISLLSGWVASRGWSTLRLVDADPLLFRNWIRVTISVGLLTAFLTLAVHYLVSHLERHYLSAIRAMAQIRYLNRRLESAKEEEKQFLARELHDEFGQTLTALKLRFQMIGRSAIAPDVGSQVQESVKLVDGLIDRVRRISIDLRPPLLDEVGVVPALRAFLDAQSGHSGVKMALMMDGIEGRLAPETEMVCYRIVQEAVTNVLRHASAHTITVSIERSDRAIAIDVRDDGRGFEPSETLDRADGNGHLGVVGMRERAQSLGGTFNLSSRRGSGTSVSATLPV